MNCGRCKKKIDECECDDIGECDIMCDKCGSRNIDSVSCLMEWGYVVKHRCKSCGRRYNEDL